MRPVKARWRGSWPVHLYWMWRRQGCDYGQILKLGSRSGVFLPYRSSMRDHGRGCRRKRCISHRRIGDMTLTWSQPVKSANPSNESCWVRSSVAGPSSGWAGSCRPRRLQCPGPTRQHSPEYCRPNSRTWTGSTKAESSTPAPPQTGSARSHLTEAAPCSAAHP